MHYNAMQTHCLLFPFYLWLLRVPITGDWMLHGKKAQLHYWHNLIELFFFPSFGHLLNIYVKPNPTFDGNFPFNSILISLPWCPNKRVDWELQMNMLKTQGTWTCDLKPSGIYQRPSTHSSGAIVQDLKCYMKCYEVEVRAAYSRKVFGRFRRWTSNSLVQ